MKQRAAWRAPLPVVDTGGVLPTARNLVFQGRSDGVLTAYRATDGRQLWQFDGGTGVLAPPVTYLVNGIQHVSVMADWGGAHGAMNAADRGKLKPGYGRVLTFALGGTATFAVPAFRHAGPPMPAITMNASPETVHEGKLLYGRNCSGCHGLDAVAGTVPDLRCATEAVHDQFEAIVLGGMRSSLGMPPFKDLLRADQVHAIQAYVLLRAKEGAALPSK